MQVYNFSNFKYSYHFSPTSKFACVLVTFFCDGQLIKRYVFIPKHKSVDCIEEAKKVIEKENSDGSLIEYVHKYNRRNSKKILITLIIVFSVIAAASIGLLIYHFFIK